MCKRNILACLFVQKNEPDLFCLFLILKGWEKRTPFSFLEFKQNVGWASLRWKSLSKKGRNLNLKFFKVGGSRLYLTLTFMSIHSFMGKLLHEKLSPWSALSSRVLILFVFSPTKFGLLILLQNFHQKVIVNFIMDKLKYNDNFKKRTWLLDKWKITKET